MASSHVGCGIKYFTVSHLSNIRPTNHRSHARLGDPIYEEKSNSKVGIRLSLIVASTSDDEEDSLEFCHFIGSDMETLNLVAMGALSLQKF